MVERRRVAVPPAPERSRAGLMALKSKIAVRGLGAVDRRTAGARAMLAFKRDLIKDLGGPTAVSAAQRALVHVCAQTKLLVDHADAALFAMPRLVTRRGKLVPLVAQRQRLADLLTRTLGQLGLERRAGPSGLADLLARQSADDPRPHGGA